MGGGSEYSDEVATNIDKQVREIVSECYKEAKKIIKDNRVVMDRLVDLLIEKETIEGHEFRDIVKEYTAIPEKNYYISQF